MFSSGANFSTETFYEQRICRRQLTLNWKITTTTLNTQAVKVNFFLEYNSVLSLSFSPFAWSWLSWTFSFSILYWDSLVLTYRFWNGETAFLMDGIRLSIVGVLAITHPNFLSCMLINNLNAFGRHLTLEVIDQCIKFPWLEKDFKGCFDSFPNPLPVSLITYSPFE